MTQAPVKMTRRFAFLLVGVSALVSGCGTLATATGKKEEFGVYSGTKRSVENGAHTWLDIPFSVVADTLLLPVTVTRAAVSQPAPEGEKHPAATPP